MTWHPLRAGSSAQVQEDLSSQHASRHGQQCYEPSMGAVGKVFLVEGQQLNLKNTHKLSCSESK